MSPVAFSRGRTSLLTMPLGGATAEMKASTSARWRLTSNPSLKNGAQRRDHHADAGFDGGGNSGQVAGIEDDRVIPILRLTDRREPSRGMRWT